MNCPKCESILNDKLINGISIDQCRGCSGMWFQKSELSKTSNVVESKLKIPNGSKETGFSCPDCNSRLYQIVLPNVNINIDICENCSGIWLDKGEFAKITHKPNHAISKGVAGEVALEAATEFSFELLFESIFDFFTDT